MTFRPDSPLNRLIILWPGVPIGACAIGFGLALYEVSQSHSRAFAALAIAMGFGLALSIGLLFHSFFIAWLEISVTRDGLLLRPVGLAWFKAQPQLLPWDRIQGAREVVTRDGGHLQIATSSQTYTLDRTLFREETFSDLCHALATGRPDPRTGYDRGLAAAA